MFRSDGPFNCRGAGGEGTVIGRGWMICKRKMPLIISKFSLDILAYYDAKFRVLQHGQGETSTRLFVHVRNMVAMT
jgi:hypothetical protein